MKFDGSVSLVYWIGILHRFLVIVFYLKLDFTYSMFYSHPSLSCFPHCFSLIIYAGDKQAE